MSIMSYKPNVCGDGEQVSRKIWYQHITVGRDKPVISAHECTGILKHLRPVL
jgi:hypothetical protein